MSHKKAGGSTRLGRDSISKRLGVKIHDGQAVKKGMIIVRQRGTRIHPSKNVARGADDTLFAMADGAVKFSNKKRIRFDGTMVMSKFVQVVEKTK